MRGGAEAQQTNETVKNRLARGVEEQVLDGSKLVIDSIIKIPMESGNSTFRDENDAPKASAPLRVL